MKDVGRDEVLRCACGWRTYLPPLPPERLEHERRRFAERHAACGRKEDEREG
jgi:hypothetical protein